MHAGLPAMNSPVVAASRKPGRTGCGPVGVLTMLNWCPVKPSVSPASKPSQPQRTAAGLDSQPCRVSLIRKDDMQLAGPRLAADPKVACSCPSYQGSSPAGPRRRKASSGPQPARRWATSCPLLVYRAWESKALGSRLRHEWGWLTPQIHPDMELPQPHQHQRRLLLPGAPASLVS